MTNNLVNFGNFFNYIILSPIFLLSKKHVQKILFGRNGQFPSAWGITIKTCERVSLGGMSKIVQIQFFDPQMYLHYSLNTKNLKLFRNHGGIYRFRRKFKKGSGEIKPLGVHINMIICNWQYICLQFC